MAHRPATASEALLAWAYRDLVDRAGYRRPGGEKVYTTHVTEFMRAAEALYPDIVHWAVTIDEHADNAVRKALEEPARRMLAGMGESVDNGSA